MDRRTDTAAGLPGPPDGESDAAELSSAHRIQLAVTRLARMMRREVRASLTPSQASALSTIRTEGPLTLGELAERESVAPPSITSLVRRLEADGYVERVPDPSDARVCRVRVTRTAEGLVIQARERKANWLLERMDRLSEEQRRALVDSAEALEALTELP